MTLDERIKESMARMLRRDYHLDCNTVTSYDETTINLGYCETCWYEIQVVDIYYVNSYGKNESFQVSDSFAELIRNLTDED